MKVTQKKLGDGKLQLEAVATPAEVDRALRMAQIGFAQQMGLRPQKDKTIEQIAEESMGIKDLDSVVESSAVEYLAPFAIDKKNIIPAFPPTPMPSSSLKRGQEFAFRLYVMPKPDYELTSYDPVEITVQPLKVDTSEIDKQLAEMAERYAGYETDEPHVIGKGDSCQLSLKCFRNGEPIPGLTSDARTYTAGIGLMPDGFDENIIGMNVGETKSFTFEGPGLDDNGNEITEVIECTVTVNETQKKVIPEIDDEWVKTYMPMYKGVEDLRRSMEAELTKYQRQQYDEYVRQIAAAELSNRFQGRIDDAVYESMQKNLIQNLRQQLQQQGMSYDQYVEQNGGQQQFGMMMMMQTRSMLVQGYALDAVFRHEGLILSDEDLDDVCRSMNPQNPRGVREEMEKSGRGFALRESAERMKANKWVVEHAKITYADAPGAAAEAPAAE